MRTRYDREARQKGRARLFMAHTAPMTHGPHLASYKGSEVGEVVGLAALLESLGFFLKTGSLEGPLQ